MNAETYGSFSKEAANNLDITTSTLRRWSIALEKDGYKFEKNDKGQRIYYERDYKALREIKSLLKSGRPFDECVHAVVARVEHDQKTLSVHEKEDEMVRLSKSELQDMLTQAAELGSAQAIEKMKQNPDLVRDRMLMESLRKSLTTVQEQQKSLLETAAAQEKQQKRWWKFWSKDK
jgi:DNA-binding transcriptional MerR regulator